MVTSGSPPAVIVGFELNGLGVARALAKHGVECIGVGAPYAHPALRTNTCKVISCAEWSQEVLLRTLADIGKRQKRKAALLITKEVPVRWISDAREQLAEFYELSLPEKTVVDGLLDKAAFGQLAEREGWPIPRTWRIRSRDDLLGILAEVPFPCILKPKVHSDLFGDHAPRKAFKLHDATELVRTYQMAAQWADAFVLQEWIEGGDDRISFCLTYYGRQAGSHVLFAGRKLRQFPPECGNTALCEPAPRAWREPICALTEKIWQSVGFKGLGSIEYKMRIDSDQPVIMEPTVGRTNYQNELAVLNGVNLPLIAYCDLVGLPWPTSSVSARPCKLVDGLREMNSARHYFRAGTLTYNQWMRDRRGRCRYMTFRANDPGPFIASVREGVRSSAGKLVERVFGRTAKLKLKGALQSVRGS